jgi:hypothetical protein
VLAPSRAIAMCARPLLMPLTCKEKKRKNEEKSENVVAISQDFCFA